MSNINAISSPPNFAIEPIGVKELTELLIKDKGIKEGRYELVVEFQIGIVNLQNQEGDVLPTSMTSFKSVGLVKVENDTPNSVNAGKLSKTSRKTTKKNKE